MKRRYLKSAWTKKQWLIFLDMLFLGVLGLCESSLKFRFTPSKWPPALLKIQFLWSEPRGSFLVVRKQSRLSYDLREAKHSALWVDSPTAQWASAHTGWCLMKCIIKNNSKWIQWCSIIYVDSMCDKVDHIWSELVKQCFAKFKKKIQSACSRL